MESRDRQEQGTRHKTQNPHRERTVYLLVYCNAFFISISNISKNHLAPCTCDDKPHPQNVFTANIKSPLFI